MSWEMCGFELESNKKKREKKKEEKKLSGVCL
jgi:hypothetical protein